MACLDSVLRACSTSPGAWEIIVVDNGSSDGGRELVAARSGDGVRLVEAPGKNIGAARNAGASQASGDIFWFLDADCVAEPGHVNTLRELFDDPGLIASGCRVRYPLDRSWIERTWHLLHYRASDGERSYINSGNLVVRTGVFWSIDGFSESLVTGEDAEIGARLRAIGAVPTERQALAVTHLDNPRTLGAFFRKEVWHAHGGAMDLRSGKVDLVSGSAVLHGLLCGSAILSALWFLSRPSWMAGLLAALLPWVIPGLSVAYRMQQVRRRVGLVQALVLYQAYFLARAVALVTARS